MTRSRLLLPKEGELEAPTVVAQAKAWNTVAGCCAGRCAYEELSSSSHCCYLTTMPESLVLCAGYLLGRRQLPVRFEARDSGTREGSPRRTSYPGKRILRCAANQSSNRHRCQGFCRDQADRSSSVERAARRQPGASAVNAQSAEAVYNIGMPPSAALPRCPQACGFRAYM
jgi:hypothetical protein